MNNALITNNDGSLIRLNWKVQQSGRYTVDVNNYGPDGYYMAALSMTKRDIAYAEIEKAIDPTENPNGTVELY